MTEVNGSKVNNLRDLVKAVESAPGPYIRFDLDYNQVRGECQGDEWGQARQLRGAHDNKLPADKAKCCLM